MGNMREQYLELPVGVKLQYGTRKYREYPLRVQEFISKIQFVKHELTKFSNEVLDDIIQYVKDKGGSAFGELYIMELLQLLRQTNLTLSSLKRGDSPLSGIEVLGHRLALPPHVELRAVSRRPRPQACSLGTSWLTWPSLEP